VDIIIPVYKGYEVTKACIESVLASENTIETNVYVINDASPEPELNAYLSWLSDNAPVTVLHNTSNLGFPRTVNKGFGLNPDHDVILLNSDTLVFSDWADRMARAAYSSHDIGTVTPFSNNATICSYPFINKENPLPTEISPAELDRIFKRINAGGICDLPTGVGFCMYFKRVCLGEVGDFDVEAFGRGYGEENDFCVRASALGWRNVLAADVYVPHYGSLSFGGSRNLLLEKNLAVLNRRHESYTKDIERFVIDDPVLCFRRAVDEQVIASKAGRPLKLRICHGFGGGTAKRLRDEAKELLEQGFRVATLRPANGREKGEANLAFEDALESPNLTYSLPRELDTLLDLLKRQTTQWIILHHFLELDPCVLQLPQMLKVPHTVVVHDYAWYCPRINLIDHTEKYCGEPDVKQCQRCVDLKGGGLGEDITVEELMERSTWIMQSAASVIAPCEDTATRVHKRLGLGNLQVIPHDPPITSRHFPSWDGKERLRVAVIGGIGMHKGYDVLLACAKDAAVKSLPIVYYVVGTTSADTELFATGKVWVTGKYPEACIGRLIRKNNIHVSLFLSKWPETWCYALTESLKSDLNYLAFNIGSFKERTKCTKSGLLLKTQVEAHTINHHLLTLSQAMRMHLDNKKTNRRQL
jgi:GT2 family glycosyltransferase